MATPQALTAVIRASRPDFTSTADKAAFAVHAILSVNGFSLRRVGKDVDASVEQGFALLPGEEVDLGNWNQEAQQADGGMYSFLYVPESGGAQRPTVQQQQDKATPQPQPRPPVLLVKCLRLAVEPPVAGTTGGGDSRDAKAGDVNVSRADGFGGDGGGSGDGPRAGGVLLISLADVSSGHPPVSLELQLDRYVSSLAPGGAGYEHLDELIRRVQEALEEALDGAEASSSRAVGATSTSSAADRASRGGRSSTAAAAAAAAAEAVQRQQEEAEEASRTLRQAVRDEEGRQRRDPLRDERYPQPVFPSRMPPGWGPIGVGDEDLMPGGLPRPPGLGGLVGPGGGGPRGLGGGMHVGPENPIFADRLRHPRGGPGFPPGVIGSGGALPGMRWDPIAPEGLQGWAPDDYTRGGRTQHDEGLNDIGRPQPGRGPYWDNMFG
ncbi:hypothetical protein VaNZ11_007661 [Volvox africanus]|uniref:PI31 proteasome regulator C-terminal domain-containing protein n=1 Tax=Volvox africanus TaxID=51714 RepID=A0ABQ5S3A9_9CHLO|nr:hypothetical protein VaNZ11_007661 [Volvox africanus]